MVSSRRISRACSKAKYQGKRRAGQALRPVHDNISWGQALARRRSPICPRARCISSFCENVAMLPRRMICSQSFARDRGQGGAHDCRGVCALGVVRAQAGLSSARWRGHRVHEGQAHFLVLGELCQVASDG